MITPKEYIIQKLKNFSSLFPKARARYENVSWDDSHYIEVKPEDFHKNSIEYKNWKTDTVFDFIEKYPNQSIYFSSEFDLCGIDFEFQVEDIPIITAESKNVIIFNEMNVIVTFKNSPTNIPVINIFKRDSWKAENTICNYQPMSNAA